MILRSFKIPVNLIILLLFLVPLCEAKAQEIGEIEKYSQKYPGISVVLTSLKQDLEIEMIDGKPILNVSEFKENLALNNNAVFFADSKEKFGSVYKFKNIEAFSLVPEKGGYKKIHVTNFNKSYERSNTFYHDIIDYNFTFPSVVRGTKMVSSFRMSSDDPFFAHKFYFGNYFPCDDFTFTVTCPANVEIRYKIFGKDTSIVKFSSSKKGGNKVYVWRTSNPKSYTRDEYAPDFDYFVPHVIVQISKYTYKGKTINVNNSLDDLYKALFKKINNLNVATSWEIKALTDSLTSGITSDKEKVRKIYNWVQKNIKYVAFEDGENGYVPREASLVLRRKYGDCKDKTSLLVAMIRSQGLNASYSWIGTRDIPYKVSDFANSFNFNHMIAVWWDAGKNPVILDGTTQHQRLEDIPSSIQGKECLIEDGPDNYKLYLIPVDTPGKNTVYDSLIVELKRDTLVGKGISVINGEMRSHILNSFDGRDSTDLPEILNDLMPKASNKFIIKSVMVKTTEADTTLKLQYEFYLPDYLTAINNISYLNLNLDRFLSETNLKEDRWTPVELISSKKHIFICTYKVPDGYEVRDIPKNSSFENKLFGFNHSYKINNNEIIVKTAVTLDFQLLENEEIAQFREMLGQLNKNYIKTIPVYKIGR